MVSDTSSIAHATGGDNDMKSGQLGNGFAFIDGFGKSELWRVQQPAYVDCRVETSRVLAENFGGAYCERRIEKNRCGWNLAALHQIDQIDDQFLSTLHGEGGDEQRAFSRSGVTDFCGQACAACIGCDRRSHSVAIGR